LEKKKKSLEEHADQQHAHYVGKLGARFKDGKEKTRSGQSRVFADAPIIQMDVRLRRPPSPDQSCVFADAPIIQMDVSVSGNAKEVIAQAKEFAKKELVGKDVYNADLKQSVTISMSGVKHTLSGTTGRDLALSVFKLEAMIKQGKLLASLPDKKGNKSVKQHHYLGVKLDIGGAIHDVVMDIREMADGHWYYDHSFEKKAVAGATPLSQPDKPVTGTTATTVLDALVGSTRAQPGKNQASTPNTPRTEINLGQLLGKVKGVADDEPVTVQEATQGKGYKIPPKPDDQPEIIGHKTRKGKVIRGVVRKDLTYAQAKAIDE